MYCFNGVGNFFPSGSLCSPELRKDRVTECGGCRGDIESPTGCPSCRYANPPTQIGVIAEEAMFSISAF